MQKAFVITLIISVPMAMLSCYLVLKGWSLMGDAISHSVLPGVVLAYMLKIPLAIGAFVAGIFCALSVGYLKENTRVKEDTVMGVVFSGMFALGLVLYLNIESEVHLDHILFGNMLGITWGNIVESGLISLACFIFLFIKRIDLLVNAFDEQHAKAIHLPINVLKYGLLISLSLMVVAALTSIGIILAIAMLITPGACAYLLARKFDAMLIIALAVSQISCFLGIYISFFIDSAPAPTIVMSMSILFMISFMYKSLTAHTNR